MARACASAGSFADQIDINQLFRALTADEANRMVITGALNHAALSKLLPMASLTIVSSKLAEAFGMVAVESLSAGVLPLCQEHSGLLDILDKLAAAVPEVAGISRPHNSDFFASLPNRVLTSLRILYPNGFHDHSTIDQIGRHLRRFATTHYSWSNIAKQLTS